MNNYLKIALFAVLAAAVIYGTLVFDIGRGRRVTDFMSCAAAENQILESYPRQCRDRNGFIYAETVAASSTSDLIRIDEPAASSSLSAPFSVSGQARGQWFFEGSFPIKVIGIDGTELGTGIARANGEWMTTDFVPFVASVSFDPKGNVDGFVRFVRDNPSGLPGNDAHVDVPVHFTLKNKI
ncbi:MAG: Gmad2 immunoglobulin-like domain-containing protein [Candidatus Paceibacterota bacterium]|jgi:hypothetical protein